MNFSDCDKTECRHYKDGKCKLGNEIDELIDDFYAEDIPINCLYWEEIEVAASEFRA